MDKGEVYCVPEDRKWRMAPVDITKFTAAQRQIDAAIRILFSGEDPLAVHTVAAAAHRLVLDLTGKRGQNPYAASLRETLTTLLRVLPSSVKFERELSKFEKFFRNHLNRPANFLKHADRDAGDSLDQDSLQTDLLLLVSCTAYEGLGLDLTPEMEAFCRWHLAVYPHEVTDPIKTGAGYLHDLSRPHQLEAGDFLLSLYRERLESAT